jgi:hypothetical protein
MSRLPRCQCGGKLKGYGKPRPNPRWKCQTCGKVHAAADINVLLLLEGK